MQWTKRSPEVAALLNPAFCGILLFSAIDGFISQDQSGMPFTECFLVLPLVLHTSTRESFPASMRTPFHAWANAHGTIRIGLAERVSAAASTTRESLIYLMNRNALVIQGDSLAVGRYKPSISKARQSSSEDVKFSVQSASLLGRLLAHAGRPSTVFATLGITP